MNSTVTAHSAQNVVTTTQRLFVRRDPPVWPFVWRGLLPLAGLAALTWFALVPFARDWVETTVRQQTRADLDAQGFNWVELTVSGQNLVLSGKQPQPDAGERALQLARASVCPTWVGLKPCAVDVAGRFDAPAPATAPDKADTAPAKPDTARAPAKAESPPAAPVLAAKACEQEMAGLLRSASILFASGQAQISPSSNALLDKLAAAARACPATVRVEGHTDNVGDAQLNQTLSAARAAAVRDALVARGLAPNRLVTQGFGATQPLNENATPAARAANRRIELRPVDAN